MDNMTASATTARRVKEGDAAPDFTLTASNGKNVSLKDFKGKNVVLYFYPKDDTPGCTVEACQLRDEHATIEGKKAVILGVSPDGVESHVRFIKKFDLPFVLLADEGAKVAEKYGVWVEKFNYGKKFMGIERSTFLIDGEGKIIKVWRRVKPDGHAQQIIDALG